MTDVKLGKMADEDVEQALYVLEAHSAYGAKVRAHIAALMAEAVTTKEAAAVVAQAWQEERDTLIAERDGARDMYESAEREVKALTEERDRLLAQGQADHRALHDALGWAHTWHGKDLPAPSRAVVALISERDEAQRDVEQRRAMAIREIAEQRAARERAERNCDALTVERDRARKAAHAAISALLEVAKVLTDDKAEPALGAARRVVSERDAYKRDFEAELAGAAGLREKYGAREGETFFAFVGRLAAGASERDALRERVTALETERETWARMIATARQRGDVLESRLAATRQRAGDEKTRGKVAETCAIMGSLGTGWDVAIHADVVQRGLVQLVRDVARGVARYIVGESAPAVHPAYGAATKDGRATCPRCSFSVEAPGTYGRVPEHSAPSEPQPVSELDGLQDDAPTGTELDGLRRVLAAQAARKAAPPPEPNAVDPMHPTGRCTCAGEGTCEWCCDAVTREQIPEPTTAEAFAMVRETLDRAEAFRVIVGPALNKLSLLERRMGALERWVARLPHDVQCGSRIGPVPCDCTKSVAPLTGAPPVFTLEEVRAATERPDLNTAPVRSDEYWDGYDAALSDARARLAALRRQS